MGCEYVGCNKPAIVKIFHTNYCIRHSIEVLISLYFLYDDKEYDKMYKVLKVLLNEKDALNIYQISTKAGLTYHSTKKILLQLKSLDVVEEVNKLWSIKNTEKYLGLINTNG